MKMIALLALALAAPAAAQVVVPAVAPKPVATPADTLHLELSTGGAVVIAMRPDKAPGHVARIKQLTRAKFYDGLVFHRVIEGFMAQTGDPLGTGAGGSPLPDLKAEFNDLPHLRGTLSMARTDTPDTANSQFFITFMPVLRLDGKYTALGRVTQGMQFVDAIKRGEGENGSVQAEPSKIVRAWIEADGPNAPKVALVVPPPVVPAVVPPVAAPVTSPVPVTPAPAN